MCLDSNTSIYVGTPYHKLFCLVRHFLSSKTSCSSTCCLEAKYETSDIHVNPNIWDIWYPCQPQYPHQWASKFTIYLLLLLSSLSFLLQPKVRWSKLEGNTDETDIWHPQEFKKMSQYPYQWASKFTLSLLLLLLLFSTVFIRMQ